MACGLEQDDPSDFLVGHRYLFPSLGIEDELKAQVVIGAVELEEHLGVGEGDLSPGDFVEILPIQCGVGLAPGGYPVA